MEGVTPFSMERGSVPSPSNFYKQFEETNVAKKILLTTEVPNKET